MERLNLNRTNTLTSIYDEIELREYLMQDKVKLVEGATERPLFNIRVSQYIESKRMCSKCTGGEGCQTKGVMTRMHDDGELYVLKCGLYGSWRNQQKLEKVMLQANIPNAYTNTTLENYRKYTKESEIAHAYMITLANDENTQGAYIFGASGLGKTHLAVGLLKKKMERGNTGVFVVVPELMENLRRCLRESGDDFEILQALYNVDCLVLDDLGAEKATEWVAERLYLIINQRYLSNRMTVITSNCNPQEIEERLGEQGKRITSRVLEMCKIIQLKGEDYRVLKAKGER
nr:MAG TPA: Replicative helicase [Bacteriophage sp.]